MRVATSPSVLASVAAAAEPQGCTEATGEDVTPLAPGGEDCALVALLPCAEPHAASAPMSTNAPAIGVTQLQRTTRWRRRARALTPAIVPRAAVRCAGHRSASAGELALRPTAAHG